MAGASSEGEVNHWPAFVDVLTTVIMVVTFLLVIMSSAVMMLSQRVIKQAETNAAKMKELTVKIPPTAPPVPVIAPLRAVAELGAPLKTDHPINGAEPLTIITRETKDTLKLTVKSIEVPKTDKGTVVTTADTLLKIAFEPAAMNYDDASTQKVIDFLHAHPNRDAAFEVWSFVPQTGSISQAERVAFYRAAMTRNLLVKAGISPKSITTQIRLTNPDLPDGNIVRVVLKP